MSNKTRFFTACPECKNTMFQIRVSTTHLSKARAIKVPAKYCSICKIIRLEDEIRVINTYPLKPSITDIIKTFK